MAMQRVSYLDGLRGFAALQVVLLHYLTAFAPAIANVNPAIPHPGWEDRFIHSPCFFLADGYMAVSIFFLISGLVLTYSFESSADVFGNLLARRVVRLGVPMAASVLLGALWFLLFPGAHAGAAAWLGGNDWLRNTGPAPVTAGLVAKEILLCGLLLGHAHFSLILPGSFGERAGLLELSQSPNAPLWTLHLELYGSLLLLGLVMLERRLSAGWCTALRVALLLVLIAHPLGLFIIGHWAAKMLQAEAWRARLKGRVARVLAVLALGTGIAMSAHLVPAGVIHGFLAATRFEKLPMRVDEFHFYSHFGAILIFFAVLALPGAQSLLGSRLGLLLGRYSFSLYLVHFPILLTVTMACLLRLHDAPPALAIGTASACGLAATVVAALLFERLVDRPAISLSRFLRIFGRRTRALPVEVARAR
jgi:peptidoglycan/LPS O-acetylase OafA/YrhL